MHCLAGTLVPRACPRGTHDAVAPEEGTERRVYLDGYVTELVHSRCGSGLARAGGSEPADDAGHLGRWSGDGGEAGGAAADCSPWGVAAPAGAARGGARRGPPGSAAAGLQPPPSAAF